MQERFVLSSLGEVDALANHLAQLCPNPKLAFIGLKELLINAVEHGCLGITYQEKTILLRDGPNCWEREIERRTALMENTDKNVLVEVELGENEIRFLINDPGLGFDWTPFMQDESEPHANLHGRGIALAKQMSFHHLEYRKAGSEVLAVVRLEPSDTADSLNENIEDNQVPFQPA